MLSWPGAPLVRRAQDVLDHNRRGTWTCPSRELYPHLWLWDSCFVAIGVARYDAARAADELRALFRGQWSNGMLPHVVFADGRGDIGSRRLWQSKRNPLAPPDVETSCITQPPLPAIAVWRAAAALPGVERRRLLVELFPPLVEYHRWLYRERDLHHRGLVTLIHPWECGLDTTPPWMRELATMRQPWWLRVALRLHLARVVRFVRRDTKYVPAAQRPSDDDGLRMLVLARRAKRHNFELRRMPERESVLVEDLAFNALLATANRALIEIANAIGTTIDTDLATCVARTTTALEQLWDDDAGQYFSRDAVTGELIKVPTVATFLPLWSESVPRARVNRLVDLLTNDARFWPSYPVPSVAVDAPDFDANRYWDGPTWVNMNWLIIQGLRACSEAGVADRLSRRTIELVERAGCYEYFSPTTGRGFGAAEFSWTAALVVDLLASAEDVTGATTG